MYEIGDFVRITEPVDPRRGQVGTVTLVSRIPDVEDETWICVSFPDGDEQAYEENEITPA